MAYRFGDITVGVGKAVKSAGGFLKNTWDNLTGKTANDIAAQGVNVSKYGIDSTYKANAENIAAQERINQANIDWAKQLNNIEMARADSSHQREAADLRKAGLSPFSALNGADVGTLAAPTLNAPLNDVGSIGSSFNNMASALGNQAQVVNTTRENTLSYALGMLNFVKGEQSLKHQKDYDNETIELAKNEFNLSAQRDSINNAYTQILSDRAKIESDNSLSEEQRKKELFAYDLKLKSLEVSNQQLTNQNMAIANNRSQLAYQSEQKDFAYKDRMLEVQYNRECQQLAYTIAQTHSSNMDYVLKLKEKAQRDKDFELTEAQINKIAEELKIDKKKFKLSVWSEVIGDILGVGKIAADVVRTSSWAK